MIDYKRMIKGCAHAIGAICAVCAGISLPRSTTPPVPARRRRARRVVLRAPMNAFTGYGLHACRIVRDLQKMRYELAVRPTSLEETFVTLPARARKTLVYEVQPEEWELLLIPPNGPVTAGKRTVYFTMWETTALTAPQVGYLNDAECIIVPSQWNARCFRESGVQRPIHIVPLGIDTDVFQPAPMEMKGPCVFGAAARLQSGETRKGLAKVMELFARAFPHERDVRLHVKAFPDCPVAQPADDRILVTKRYLSPPALARWFAGLTCFVSAARGEGWGLMQHQALAVGRPLISVRFGGVAEFFQPEMGYPVDFQLVPATGEFAGHGCWAEADEDQIVAAMRAVYAGREEARARGAAGARHARRYGWEQSNAQLARVIQQVGMVPAP